MKHEIKTCLKIIIFSAFFIFLSASPASATMPQYSNSGPDLGAQYPAAVGLTNVDIRLTIAKIIRVAMGFLGVIFLGIILFGGYEWMTAGGNDEKVSQAKKRIYTGVIGLAVILSSYAISYFVIMSLTAATTAGGATSIY